MSYRSPITNSDNVEIIGTIDVESIIKNYLANYQIDVSYLFKNIDKVLVLVCKDTGYKFFYPSSITGDGVFYESLQKFEWYYMPWKWEHEQAFTHIGSNCNLLEVGCGKGDFLKEIKRRVNDITVTGLELNQKAIIEGQSLGLNIFPESIQTHACENAEKYDIVCSFQVLEHISDVKSFIEAQVKALKNGGKLIVSVPNNNGFLGDSENLLNLPPHHMGLWGEESLKKLGQYFNLKFESVVFEPLQSYHLGYYSAVRSSKLKKYNLFIRLLSKLSFIDNFLFPSNYKAFTIQVTWIK